MENQNIEIKKKCLNCGHMTSYKCNFNELKRRIVYINSLKPHSDEWCDEVQQLLKFDDRKILASQIRNF